MKSVKTLKIMKVHGCGDCPFLKIEFDDFAVGIDTLETCGLAEFTGLELITIKAYDTKEGEQTDTETPEWCPIKNKSIEINYVI